MDADQLQQAHRHFAAEAFNACWELIGLPKRTPGEDREMIRRAEASFWHWQHVEERKPENDAIGCWQLARVYALASHAEPALEYARLGIEAAEQAELGPFYEAYAWESAARAFAVAGLAGRCADALRRAAALAGQVEDAADRKLLDDDLATIEVPGGREADALPAANHD
jgi:hypothetical protein